jgi:WD40 repeat protein
LATGQARDVPVVGGNRADDLAISPGGRYVALAVNDPTPRGGPFSPRTPIRVYDGKSLEILWEHDPAGGRTWSIEFSPDGTQLAVARDNTVEFRHSATGKPSAETIYQEFEQIHSICYSADGRLLATGTELGAVHVWLIAGANPAKLYEPWSEITAVVVVQDGEVVVTGSTGEIYAWEASDGSPSRRIAVGEDHYGMAMPNEVNDLCVSPNGKSVAVGCRDGALACWDLTTGNQHFSHRAGLQVVPGGSTIGQQGILNFGGNQGYRSLPGHSDSVTGVDFSSDGSVLASASRDKTVRLWDMNAPDKEVGFYRLGDVFQLADVVPTCIRYSPDDQFLAIGCADGWIQQLDVSTGQVVRKIGPQQNSIRRMEFSSNGERLLSVVGDSLQIWRVSDGKCLQSIPQCLYASVEIQRCPEWPFQVVHGDRETTLQTAQGVPLAWIPDALDRFMLLPAGATATGSALSHFYMFALEGFWPGRVLMTQTTPAQAKGVLQQVQDLLDTRQPEKALELLTDNRQEDDDRWNNAYGVCYLRMGEFEESRKKFRGLVFSGPGMAFRSEAAVVFKTNFAATLLAEGRLEECLERLREINDEQAPCVQQLRQTIEGWKNRQSRLRRWFGLFGGRPHVATIRELALGELQ